MIDFILDFLKIAAMVLAFSISYSITLEWPVWVTTVLTGLVILGFGLHRRRPERDAI